MPICFSSTLRYALHIKHKDYRKAAEAMFRLSKAAIAEGMPLDNYDSAELQNPWYAKRTLRRLRTQRTCIELCTDALTTATAALRLLPRSEDRLDIREHRAHGRAESSYSPASNLIHCGHDSASGYRLSGTRERLRCTQKCTVLLGESILRM